MRGACESVCGGGELFGRGFFGGRRGGQERLEPLAVAVDEALGADQIFGAPDDGREDVGAAGGSSHGFHGGAEIESEAPAQEGQADLSGGGEPDAVAAALSDPAIGGDAVFLEPAVVRAVGEFEEDVFKVGVGLADGGRGAAKEDDLDLVAARPLEGAGIVGDGFIGSAGDVADFGAGAAAAGQQEERQGRQGEENGGSG